MNGFKSGYRPENWWLGDDPFLFRQAHYVSFREGVYIYGLYIYIYLYNIYLYNLYTSHTASSNSSLPPSPCPMFSKSVSLGCKRSSQTENHQPPAASV